MPLFFKRVCTEMEVYSKTDDYTVTYEDFGCEFEFNKATAVTCNLPAGGTVGNGYNVCLRNIGVGDLTVDPNGSETIDGASTLVIEKDRCHWIRCDGSNWRTFAICEPPSSGGGKVLQVVSTAKTDTFSTTSSSFVDVTGLSVSITPASSLNKILVMATVGAIHDNQGYTRLQLVRDSTPIFVGDSSGSRIQATINVDDSDSGTNGVQGITFLDSPSKTTSTTYKFQMSTNSGTAYLNRSHNDTDNSSHARTVSSITVMEIEG